MNRQELAMLVNELNSFTPCILPVDEQMLRNLVARIITVSKRFTPPQQRKVVEGLRFGALHHKGVLRDSNELTPYFLHTLETTCVAFDLGIFDFKLTIALIIHDTVEDTKGKSHEDMIMKKHDLRLTIQKKFGISIYVIVDALTKHENPVWRKTFWEHLRNITDPHLRWRAILGKFCDRIANSITFHLIEEDRRLNKVMETWQEFPRLAVVLEETLRKLYNSGRIRKKEYLLLPHKAMKRLFYNIEPYLDHFSL